MRKVDLFKGVYTLTGPRTNWLSMPQTAERAGEAGAEGRDAGAEGRRRKGSPQCGP